MRKKYILLLIISIFIGIGVICLFAYTTPKLINSKNLNFSQYSVYFNKEYNTVSELNSEIEFSDNFNATIKLYKKNELFAKRKYKILIMYNDKELTSGYSTEKDIYNNSDIRPYNIHYSNEDDSTAYSMVLMTPSDNSLEDITLYVNYIHLNHRSMSGSQIGYITTDDNKDPIKSAEEFWIKYKK